MSKMSAVFRPMRPSDAEVIAGLDREIFGSSIGKDALINEIRLNPLAHYFVLQEQETLEILGHIGLWIDEENAQILNFYVKPPQQGKGYGKRIIESTIEYLYLHGVKNATLEVRPSNKTAFALYTKYGFKVVATRDNYYDNGEEAYLMLKKL